MSARVRQLADEIRQFARLEETRLDGGLTNESGETLVESCRGPMFWTAVARSQTRYDGGPASAETTPPPNVSEDATGLNLRW